MKIVKFVPVLAGAVLTTGFAAACAPTPSPLACSAVTSTASPVQHSVETITVKSAPRAIVVTVAKYKQATVAKRVTANSLGLATIRYNVGPAAVGYPVKVLVAVAKSGHRGSCSTRFTPAAAVKTAPKPPPVSGSVLATCSDVSFPAQPVPTGGGMIGEGAAYDLKATATNCDDATALASHARGSRADRRRGLRHDRKHLRHACRLSLRSGYGTWNGKNSRPYECTNGAKDVTFTYVAQV